MPFLEKTVVHVHRGIEISMRLRVALWTPEQLSPSLFDAASASGREPLALGAASGAILTGAVWVHFHGHYRLCIRFLTAQPIDLPPQLVGCLRLSRRDLLAFVVFIAGGPTQRHGTSLAMRTFLEGMPRRTLHELAAWKSGSAANRIASRLKRAEATLVVPPESFFVAEREGPLEQGELERAIQWAKQVYAAFEANRSTERGRVESF